MSQTFPVQVTRTTGKPPVIPYAVHMAAYEVYAHVYGEQEALTHGWARGGFGMNELTQFLYARAFPKDEWRARVKEAGEGMTL